MLRMCVVNQNRHLCLFPRGDKTRHLITDDAEAWVKVVHPSIHVLSPLPPEPSKPIHWTKPRPEPLLRYHLISIVGKREDPPVKAIISVRRQVLLQFIVGLLYFPTEVLQLAIQRVLQAGRVVAAVHDPREPSGGSKQRPVWGNRMRQCRSAKQRPACIAASFNGNCSPSCSVCVDSNKKKEREREKRQKYWGRKTKASRGRGNARSMHRDESHVVAVVQHHGQRCGTGVVRIRETRTGNTCMLIYVIENSDANKNNAAGVVLLPLTNSKELCVFFFIFYGILLF